MNSAAIDFRKIKDVELNLFCSAIVKEALEFFDDPGNRADFERWLNENAARGGTSSTRGRPVETTDNHTLIIGA